MQGGGGVASGSGGGSGGGVDGRIGVRIGVRVGGVIDAGVGVAISRVGGGGSGNGGGGGGGGGGGDREMGGARRSTVVYGCVSRHHRVPHEGQARVGENIRAVEGWQGGELVTSDEIGRRGRARRVGEGCERGGKLSRISPETSNSLPPRVRNRQPLLSTNFGWPDTYRFNLLYCNGIGKSVLLCTMTPCWTFSSITNEGKFREGKRIDDCDQVLVKKAAGR